METIVKGEAAVRPPQQRRRLAGALHQQVRRFRRGAEAERAEDKQQRAAREEWGMAGSVQRAFFSRRQKTPLQPTDQSAPVRWIVRTRENSGDAGA